MPRFVVRAGLAAFLCTPLLACSSESASPPDPSDSSSSNNGVLDAGADANDPSDSGDVDGDTPSEDGSVPPPPSTCVHPEEPAVGAFAKIYDPSVGESKPFYINDHTVVRGADGTWHLFGITHAEPANALDEKSFAHATAPSLKGPWTKQPAALVANSALGETVLWAPYVMREGDTYYMFYCGGGSDHTKYQIRLATSTDLKTWTRESAPLFTDGYDARDPMVLRVGDQWVLYYTANSSPASGNHVVAYRTSTDLRHWGEKKIAFTHPDTGTYGGPTESPFVVQRGDDYYLFIGPRDGYDDGAEYSDTAVYHSKDPLHFEPSGQVYNFPSHAAEVVVDTDGAYYATHSGWGQGGVFLAPLSWEPTTCKTLAGSDYVATVETSPRAGLRSFEVGGKNLLSTMFRTTGPYLGIGKFGTHMAGAPAQVEVSPDGKKIELRSIAFKGQPIRADWSLCAGEHAIRQRISWTVDQTVPSVWEVAFGLNASLPQVRNDANANASGDVAGFPHWVMLSDASSSLALTYIATTAWREDNHWLSSKRATASIQPIWKSGGTSWTAGTYEGGTFHLGGSSKPNDLALPEDVSFAIPGCDPSGPP